MAGGIRFYPTSRKGTPLRLKKIINIHTIFHDIFYYEIRQKTSQFLLLINQNKSCL